MKLHANAPFGPKGRRVMVLRVIEQGWSLTEAAEAAGVSDRTCRKWRDRYLAEVRWGCLIARRRLGRCRTARRSSARRRSWRYGGCG